MTKNAGSEKAPVLKFVRHDGRLVSATPLRRSPHIYISPENMHEFRNAKTRAVILDISPELAKKIISETTKASRILHDLSERRFMTGFLYRPYIEARKAIREWIKDENRSSSDRRVLDRANLLQVIAGVAKEFNFFRALIADENNPESALVIRLDMFLWKVITAGDLWRVIMTEEIEGIIEARWAETSRREVGQARRLQSGNKPTKQEIKVMCSAVIEAYFKTEKKPPTSKVVIARVRGQIAKAGRVVPSLRTIQYVVNRDFILKACKGCAESS